MSPSEFFREFTYPLRRLSTLFSVLFFAGLFAIAVAIAQLAFMTGFFPAYGLSALLLLFITPGMIRYSLRMIEARARDLDPDPPGPETFTIFGQWWSLFPVVHAAKWALIIHFLGDKLGAIGALAGWLLAVVFQPAELATLAVTRSPLESLNPFTQVRLIHRVRESYWVIPAGVALIILVGGLLPALPLPLSIFVSILLGFGYYAVVGAMIRPFKLFDEVQILTDESAAQEKQLANLDASRSGVLDRAYGFASRGNISGALKQITQWITSDDPYPGDAWPYFFDAMLKWDDPFPALKLAQLYLDQLLAAGEQRAAAKLILRCRHLDERFRPNRESLPAAIDAARAAGNTELLTWLERI